MGKFFWEVIFPLIIVASVWAVGIIYICLKPSLWPKLFRRESPDDIRFKFMLSPEKFMEMLKNWEEKKP